MVPVLVSEGPGFCANHPETAGVILCDRCGSYACFDCDSGRADVSLCEECARRIGDEQSASWLAIAAASTGFLGLACCLPAPIGLVLGAIDLLRGGGKQPGSLKLDLLGIGLGTFGVVVWIAAALLGPDGY